MTIDAGSTGFSEGTNQKWIIDTYNNTSISQQYYTQEEVGRNSGTITHIAFKVTSDLGISIKRNIDIYMQETDASYFESNTSIPFESSTKIYGNEDFELGLTNGWITIELQNPYQYKGGNLLVCANDKTGKYTDYKVLFETFETNNNRALYKSQYSNSNPYDVSSGIRACTYSTEVPAIQFTFAEDDDNPTVPETETITLTADTETIIANGTDAVTFNVTSNLNGDVTNDCTIHQVVGTGSQIVTNPFTTTTAGTYTFYATYGSGTDAITSDEVTVTATEPVITLVPSRIYLEADGIDAIIFSVKEDETTLSSGYHIYYDYNGLSYELNGVTFTTTDAGTYTFYAEKGGLWSENVTITAEASITISADKTEIVADGEDMVTFTVMQGTDDITGNTDIKIHINGEVIAGNTFTTTTPKQYQVYATKGEDDFMHSNTITVTAKETEPTPGEQEDFVTIDGTIGGFTSYTNTLVPIQPYERTSFTQTYYLKDEINQAAETKITNIAFHTASSDDNYPCTRNIKIYMDNTDKQRFESRFSITMDESCLVFDGEMKFTAESWINFELDKAFTYNGNNVLLCIYDYTGSYAPGEDHCDFYAFHDDSEVNNERSIYKQGQGIANPTTESIGGSLTYYVPEVRFTFESETALPLTLEASKTNMLANGSDAVTFTVRQGEEQLTEGYDIYYNGTNKLEGDTFRTDEAGTYTFYAQKGSLQSEPVTITAEKHIVLNIESVTQNSVTFSVTQGGETIYDADIYIGDEKIEGYTFETTTAGTYLAYAKKGSLQSEPIAVVVDNSAIGSVFYPNGSVTYNIGTVREYTLLTEMDLKTGNATIIADNVYEYQDENYQYHFTPLNDNKPQSPTILILPDKVLNGTEWITVTKVEAHAFDEIMDEDNYIPGNALNSNFTGLIIPSTITEIGTAAFTFTMEENVICYAETPPTIDFSGQYAPFLNDTYDYHILYVLGNSIEAYRNAKGWGTGKNNTYFLNIVPLTTPTFIGTGEWNNADNWRTYIDNGDGSYTERWGVLPNDGDDILIDGDVTITAACTAITNTINIIKGSIKIEDGGQLVHSNSGISVTIEKNISGYLTRDEIASIGWHTISSPMATPVNIANVTNLLSNEYDLYYYDEPTHYWINHKDTENNNGFTTLNMGHGYLYANSNDVTLQFKGVVNHDNVSIHLNANSEYEGLRGFNLIGNPFTHNIYKGENAAINDANLSEGYYSLSNDGQWGTVKTDDTPIAPCQSILVQTTTEGALTINKTHKAPDATRASYPSIAISVANDRYNDEAYVMFKDGIGLNKVGHMNKDIPMIYVTDNSKNFAIATMNEDIKEISVGFEAKTMGQYTISAKGQDGEFNTMTLTDKMTGVKTNLLTDSYTFMATANDNPQRFVLTLNSEADTDTDFIYINNGEMIINNIEGDGLVHIFDIMGRPMAEYHVSGSANINIETFADGVYIVRMTDENGVKTQKIIRN